jgi:carbon storage regulator CsrA
LRLSKRLRWSGADLIPTIAKAPPADYFYLTNGLTTQKEMHMLTLGRKSGESVLIGDSIAVTAHTEKDSNEIRLVFDAPRDFKIVREELVKKPQGSAVRC